MVVLVRQECDLGKHCVWNAQARQLPHQDREGGVRDVSVRRGSPERCTHPELQPGGWGGRKIRGTWNSAGLFFTFFGTRKEDPWVSWQRRVRGGNAMYLSKGERGVRAPQGL